MSKEKSKCWTFRCRGRKAKGKNYCSKCRTRRDTEHHPLRIAWANLKKSAKRRKIVFTLTLDQYKQLSAEYKYQNNRGKTAKSYVVDRKNPTKGYEIGNLQFITNAENAAKAIRDRKEFYVTVKIHGTYKEAPTENEPF